MSEFGEKLRQERESRGITLVSITEATKISNRYLVALETGKFDYLPGGILNKGIMRGYARVVGLNEDAWVNNFMSAYRESGQLKDEDANWIAFAENVGKSRSREEAAPQRLHLNWAGVTVLLAVLVALGWAFWHYVDDKTAASTTPQAAMRMKAMSHTDRPVLQLPAQHKLV